LKNPTLPQPNSTGSSNPAKARSSREQSGICPVDDFATLCLRSRRTIDANAPRSRSISIRVPRATS
jgi:hypothetical protein